MLLVKNRSKLHQTQFNFILKIRSYNVKKNHKKKVLKHIAEIGVAIVSFTLMPCRVLAVDQLETANQVINSEGAKEMVNAALKVARTKPALSVAAGITCIACVPAAGVAASPYVLLVEF